MIREGELKTLHRLWSLAEREGKKLNRDANYVFSDIGLAFYRPMAHAGYYCTPTNTLSFAATGGDGVHYGLLALDDIVSDMSPVVMTVPMHFAAPNMILGADLLEFLCLGCQVGYIFEDLIYHRSESLQWLKNPEKGLRIEDHAYYLIDPITEVEYPQDVICAEFNLRPWKEFEQRLAELNNQYLPMLQVSEF